ncbi:hypothetical protein CPHO_02145 [Corynebacterium phocae]|uniref:Uncharacterized protein n=1 Tax=Corynebacterium phocae TaxID=161895 RepID=A0A1L7D186_9CORY|nr:hypothetical protein [Corynebacterium phocae]APT91905.1 hypothetical protein CPHO_02145 [Corynebacterium phocae]KAA8727363.1 hypothetical protein F4V58_01680 [Corynebacterium phocae]
MKIRRSLAAIGLAVAVSVAGTPAATAQPAPEPLAQVLRELYKIGGFQAQNLILVPAVLSSLGFLSNLGSSSVR